MPKTALNTQQTPVAQAAKTLAGRWIEVFRAGKHVDSKGRAAEFSQADLDQMIANHALGAAPAVIGHPKHNDPAYARVQEYRRDGDRLFAKFGDVHPAFDAGVQSGAYFNRSLSVYQDKQHGWRVRHVGWLGAVPPPSTAWSRSPSRARTWTPSSSPRPMAAWPWRWAWRWLWACSAPGGTW